MVSTFKSSRILSYYSTMSAPLPNIDITLYSNPGCPYVHRVFTALHELNLPFNRVFIDLETPRPDWYLKINPRGTVPALSFTSPEYNGGAVTIVNESLVILQFLADLVPGKLLPSFSVGEKTTVHAAAQKAQIAFFIDAWGSKVGNGLTKVLLAAAADGAGGVEAAEAAVKAVEKEIDPLLARGEGESLFFGEGGSVSLAEIVAAPFLLRTFAWADAGFVTNKLKEQLLALPNFGPWAREVVKLETLLKEFDQETFVEKTKVKLQQFKDGTWKPKA
ncbi:hypothetical protein Dda_4120 [Drechslerella dactyloides]|uniref:GST N-terminal domain-containing protein n=1 Tax=Drechslerella dactyloides TaxID=74499 RepID=A0AAD6J1H8_DREDA|nr:hypothetical protein Dda_4120 [Drechslerella dactyloides]